MWHFKKDPEPTVCQHKWKDFPWYMTSTWHPNEYNNRGDGEIKIIEPYICIWCKERKDVVLQTIGHCGITWKNFVELKNDIEDTYRNKLELRAEVEDKIQDFIHDVDHVYLQLYEKIHATH